MKICEFEGVGENNSFFSWWFNFLNLTLLHQTIKTGKTKTQEK